MWRTDESGKEEGSYRATFRTSAQCIDLPLRRPTKDVVGKKYDQRKQMNAQMPNANGYEQHYYVAGNAPPHHSALLLLSSSCLLLSLPRTDVQLQLVKLHLLSPGMWRGDADHVSRLKSSKPAFVLLPEEQLASRDVEDNKYVRTTC